MQFPLKQLFKPNIAQGLASVPSARAQLQEANDDITRSKPNQMYGYLICLCQFGSWTAGRSLFHERLVMIAIILCQICSPNPRRVHYLG